MLVLRPGALGDTLLAVPALRALRRANLGRPITLAAHAAAARLLADLDEVDSGIAFDDPRITAVFAGTSDEQVLVAWTSTAVAGVSILSPARPPERVHCARYLLETLSPLGIDLAFDDRPLQVPPVVSDEVLLHPGSGSPAKNWPAQSFADVARLLGRPVRMIVGEADTTAANAVQAAIGRALPRLEQASLTDLAAHLAGCSGYIGNDSGVSHLAGLCGARSVVLFGPTDPAIWSPLGPRVTTLAFAASPTEVATALERN